MTDRPRVDLIGDRVTAISVSADLRAQLLEAGEQVAQLGSFEWLPGPDQLVWSDNLYRIYGLEVGEVVPTRALMSGQTHPDDRARVARFIEMTRATRDPPPLEYRIVLPSSAVRYLRSTITTIDSCDHAATRIVGAVQDITDHHLANREIAAHVAVSRVLAEWRGMEQSGPILLRDLAAAMEFACAVLWVPEGEELVCRVFWSSAAVRNMGDFETRTRALRPQRGMELPGQVWQNRSPINITDVHGDPVFPRCAAASRAGLRGAAGFPALAAGEVLAVLEFYYREEFRPTLRLIQTMSALGYELGEFFSRRRGDLRRQPLTARELQILKLASDGNSTPQIAEHLSLSAATVKTHLDRTYRKLRASDRAAAVATALRWGLID